jgi:hypothetical protein
LHCLTLFVTPFVKLRPLPLIVWCIDLNEKPVVLINLCHSSILIPTIGLQKESFRSIVLITSESNTFLLLTVLYKEGNCLLNSMEIFQSPFHKSIRNKCNYLYSLRYISLSPQNPHYLLFSWKSNIELFNAAQSIAALVNQACCGKSTMLEIGPGPIARSDLVRLILSRSELV